MVNLQNKTKKTGLQNGTNILHYRAEFIVEQVFNNTLSASCSIIK